IFESYPEVGFNYRMTDVQAAIGRVQLSRLPQIIAHRRQMADCYADRLADIHGVTAPIAPARARSNWQSYCVRPEQPADQIQVMQSMLDDGISTRRAVMCSHRELPYAGTTASLPESERAQDSGIILPLHSTMTEAEIDIVVGALARALRTC